MKKMKLRWGLLVFLLAALFCWAPARMPVSAAAAGAGTQAGGTQASQSQSEENTSFDKQDITELYKQNKFILTGEKELSAVYTKSADGYVFSGSKDAVSGTVFSFAQEFDFSGGVAGRLDLDALAVKGNSLKADFYLDEDKEPFAELAIRNQKREGKWYAKSQTMSIYDQKITGKHKVSFRIVQSDTKKKASFVLRSVTFAKSTVPVAYFNIDESQGSIEAMNSDSGHDTECYGSVTMEVPAGYENEYGGTVKTETYQMEYIRGRGNSTWLTGKNPYKIKFEKKQNLFNMGKNKHWVLLADYYDPSHMRNKATYWAGQQLGMEFTPKGVYIDVVMNGEYYGSYMLCEQVRVGSSRVNIDDLEENDETKNATDEAVISGGYLLSLAPYGDETKKSFKTSKDIEFLIESPSFEDYENEAQYNYIKNYVQKTEDAIYSSDFTADGKSYADYLDVDSAVDYYWMQEVSMNGDAFLSTSTYLYKKRDGKLFFGPLWDFDYVAWGNNEYEDYSVSEWCQSGNMWFERLFKDKTFADKVIARWPAVKAQMEALYKDGGKLDGYAAQIKDSMKYNSYLHGNNYDSENDKYTFEDNVKQLKQWIRQRTEWIDGHLNELQVVYKNVTFKNNGKIISTQQVAQGDYAQFPALSAPKGYVFGGWYLSTKDEEYSCRMSEDDLVYDDLVLNAKWVREKDVKPVKKIILGYDRLVVPFDDYYEDEDDAYIPYTYIGGDNIPVTLNWSSSDESVVKVIGDGTLRIKKEGKAVITARTKDGKVKASCTVISIKNSYNLASLFYLNKESVKIKKGAYTVLSAVPEPDDSVNFKVSYVTSSDCVELETVGNKCVVWGVENGTAQITAVYSGDGDTMVQTCTVTVGKKKDNDTVRPGSKLTRGSLSYEVTSITKKGGTVKVTGPAKAGLKTVKIPSVIKISKKKYKVTAVAAKAFYRNRKLRRITIGNQVVRIGKQAFAGCTRLKKVTFGKRVKVVEQKAFYRCRKLGSLTFKRAGALTVRKKAFAGTAKKLLLRIPAGADTAGYKKNLKKAGAGKINIK